MRSAAARVREIAEQLEELAAGEVAADPAADSPDDRLERAVILGLAWIAVAVCEAISPDPYAPGE